ncbi:hypothetical protein [Caminibacter pacificus]|uniref:Uncharacterized protein n=1 Tax=Caminibacter pacificus TaxID=1424653 RepID=A0AAJ4UY10_9BACT|nr:hypothetical protein [Caminibacter pacificus]QCI27636.1 hypothetical protein C6V80_01250 [Caminibacter pacificus]ROR40189.1 hypothetical protein EDC58_1177 [Caminibacter pacificus]
MSNNFLCLFNNFLTNKKEQKYLKQKRNTLRNDSYLARIVDRFFAANTKEELKDFLDSQVLINFEITSEMENLSLNELKEKIAYELNEAILKLSH